jgi:DnaJ-class molecular chaperone
VLGDPQKRKIYDQWGEEGLQRGAGGNARTHFHSHDPMSIFEEFFRGQFGAGFGMQKGPPLKQVISLTLEELYTGCMKTVRVSRIWCKADFLRFQNESATKRRTKIIVSK